MDFSNLFLQLIPNPSEYEGVINDDNRSQIGSLALEESSLDRVYFCMKRGYKKNQQYSS